MAEQLSALAPRHETLYEFKLILTDAKPDSGPVLMNRYVGIMIKACSVLFDLDHDGKKIALPISSQGN